MTLEDIIAGIFGGQGQMQPPPQVGGQTPNDLIMGSLGAPGAASPPSAPFGIRRADSTPVTQSGLQPVGSMTPPQANPAPAPTSSQTSPMPQSVPEPGGFDRMGAFADGYQGGGLIGGIANAFTAPDQAATAKRQALAQNNLTFQVLKKQGLPDEDAAMLIGNPKLLQEVLQSKYKQPERQIKEIFDTATGRKQVASIDPATGGHIPIGGLEAQAPGSTGNGPFKDTAQRANIEEGLRKEIAATNKDWPVIRDAANKIKLAANDPSAAGDMALIFGYMKLLDPASVVRETEYANAENARGIPETLRNVWNKAVQGERLSEAQRADFLGQAEKIANAQAERYRQSLQNYRGVGERLGVDNKNVILENPDEVGGRGGLLNEARDAIAKGASREQVEKRLRDRGINPEGL